MAKRNRQLRSMLSRERRRNRFRLTCFENLEERRLLAYIPPTPDLGVFVEQGGASVTGGQVTNLQPQDRVTGAIETATPHPTDPNILYIGSINGGIWKTTNALAQNPTWVAQTDTLESLTIGAVEFDSDDLFDPPAENGYQTLVAGTGNFSSFAGNGGAVGQVYVTRDGGDNWFNPGGQGSIVGERISGIASKNNAQIIVATSDTGGVHRSIDGGETFTLVTNGVSTSSRFSDLVVDLSQEDRLYAGALRDGIYRSDDFGETWVKVSGSSVQLESRINDPFNDNLEMAVHPDTGRLVIGVVRGGQPSGVFFTNTGDTPTPLWTEMDVPILPVAPAAGITGATNTNPIEITANGHGLQTGDLVLIRNVGGNTAANGQWTVVRLDADRFSLIGSNGNGAYTANSGEYIPIVNPSPTFKDTSVPGGQGRIHFSMGIDPTDQDIIYMGGDRQDLPFPNAIGATDFTGSIFRGDAKRSRNPLAVPSPQWDHMTNRINDFDPSGGTINNSAPHADSRNIAFDANGNLIEVNDGGVVRRTNPKSNQGDWFSLAGNLGVVEYHNIVYDSLSNVILGGSQDNGTQLQNSENNLQWRMLSGGDGGDVVVDDVTLAAQGRSIRYSSFQNLGGFRSSIYDADNNFVSQSSPNLTVTSGPALQGQFVTPLALNSLDPTRLLIGAANGIYESFNQADSVFRASPVRVTNLTGNALVYGGRSDINGDNPAIVYAAGADGNVYSRAETTADFVSNVNLGSSVNAVEMNPNEWTEAFAIDRDTVVMTDDAGDSWIDLTRNLFSLGATQFRSISYLSGIYDGIVLGTSVGVFGLSSDLIDSGGDWFQFGSGIPNVPIWDMDYDAADDVLILGTLGRGAWKLDRASYFFSPKLTMSVDTDTIPEDGTSQAIVSVFLNRVLDYDVTVDFAFSGDATITPSANPFDPVDYQVSANSVTLLAGETVATFTVTALQDNIDELDEVILIDIDTVTTNAPAEITVVAEEFDQQQVAVTILDDDPVPVANMSVSTATVNEGDSVYFRISLTDRFGNPTVAPEDVVIDLAFTGQAIGGGVDYSGASQIVVSAGQTIGELEIETIADGLDEFNETLIATVVGNSGNITLGSFLTATTLIIDQDDPPQVSLSATPAQIDENGGLATVTATLSAPSAKNIEVNLKLDLGNSTATLNKDYALLGPLSLFIPAGATAATVQLTSLDDTTDEEDETVIFEIDSLTNATAGANPSTTVTIIDDDAPPSFILEVTPQSIQENGGVATFTARLSEPSAKEVVIDLLIAQPIQDVIAHDESIDGELSDDVASPTSITLVPGLNTINGSLTDIGDGSSATNDTLTFTVPIGFTLDAVEMLAYEAESGSTLLMLLDEGAAFPFTPSEINDPFGAPDYNSNILGGGEFGEPHDNDGISDGVAFGGVRPNLLDLINLGSGFTAPLGAGTYTLYLQDDSNTDYSIALSLNRVTPLPPGLLAIGGGVDFVDSGTRIVIPAGQTVGTMSVTAVADALDEYDEFVIVEVAQATNATEVGSQIATTRIIDQNDPPVVSISVDNATISEPDPDDASVITVASFTVSLDAPSAKEITVEVETSGDAVLGDDYTTSSTSLTIPAGETTATFTVTALTDLLDEELYESVFVSIVSAVNATIGVQQAETQIEDVDDPPLIEFTVDKAEILENSDLATFTARLVDADGNTIVSGRDIFIEILPSGTAIKGLDENSGDYFIPPPQNITILAGESLGFTRVISVQDNIHEGDVNETVILSVGEVRTGLTNDLVDPAHLGSLEAATSILDDDPQPIVSLAVDTDTIDEDEGVATFTVSLDRPSVFPISVDVDFSGQAIEGTDFTPSLNSVTFAPLQTVSTFTVTAINDSIDENDEPLTATLVNPSNVTLSTAISATTTIIDNDPLPLVNIIAAKSTISEATEENEIAVFLTNAAGDEIVSGLDVTVELAIGGTAARDLDYELPTTTLVIPAGQSSASTVVTSIPDLIDEPTETVILNVTNVSNGLENGVQSAQFTITDDNPEPTVSIAFDTLEMLEDDADASATLTATLSEISGRPVTIVLSTGGDAILNDDYTLSGSTIVIPPGQQTGSVVVRPIADALFENDESVTISVASLTHAQPGADQAATTTILNDDLPPVVTFSALQTAISEASGQATFLAELSAVSGIDVLIGLGFSGTATLAEDYTVSATSILIPAGSTTGTITITAIDDAVDEFDETVVVEIVSLSGATENTLAEPAIVTIVDNDLPPIVSIAFDAGEIQEGDAALLTASLSTVSAKDITIDLNVAGTATNPEDYTISGFVISIPAGETQGTVLIESIDDALHELDETVIITTGALVNVRPTAGQVAELTILDNDPPPTVNLAVDNTSIDENGGTATVTLTLDAVSALPVTVTLDVGGTATVGSDFGISQTTFVFEPGTDLATLTVTAIDDLLDEFDETVILSVASIDGGILGDSDSVEILIVDNDPPPAVSILFDRNSILEDGGSSDLRVSLSAVSGKDVIVGLSIAGTATGGGVDYDGLTDSVTISAGETSAVMTVVAVDDSLYELNETIDVSISSLTNAISGTSTATSLAIIDDDLPPSLVLSIDNETLAEDGGQATVTATLSEPSGLDVIVDLRFAGTATPVDDYTTSANQIMIPAGETIGAIMITSINDQLNEADETIEVSIADLVGAAEATPQLVTATIIDNDNAPTITLAVDQTEIPEAGGTATVTASISAVSGMDVIVDLATEGTASDSDFNASATQIVIPAGQTSGFIVITSIDDTIDEPDETVEISIASVSGAIEATPQSVVVTIIDDDTSPGLSLSVDNASIPELGGVAVLTATLSAVSAFDVTTSILLGGSAEGNGVDYQTTELDLLIPAGSLSANVTITALDDALNESDETIVASIQAAQNSQFDPNVTTTITIIDDDLPPSVTFDLDTDTIDESAGVAVYTATLSAVSGLDVTITPTFSGTASPSDYTLSANSIVIPAGQLIGSISITAVDDSLFEHEEQIEISPASIINADGSDASDSVLTIIDDDPFPSLSLQFDNTSVVEGESSTLSIQIAEPAGVDITVTLNFSGTATRGDDYQVDSVQVSIPAGETSASINLVAIDDSINEADETVVVEGLASDGIIIGSQAFTSITIIDNDAPPTANVRLNTFTIGEQSGQAILTADLSQISGRDIVFSIDLSGTATLDVDYTISAPQIVVPAGEISASFQIESIDDVLFEGNETVLFGLAAVDSSTVQFQTQQLELTIVDNEVPPQLTLQTDALSIPETGGQATITATMSGPAADDVIVSLRATGQGDVTNDDFSISSQQIVIPSGELSGSMTLFATDDSIVEQDGVVMIEVLSVSRNLQISPQDLSITILDDDDGFLVISTSSTPLVVREDGTTGEILVSLSAAPLVDVSVTVTSSDTGEVTATPRTLVFTPENWDAAQNVTVTGQPDLLEDGDIPVDISIAINDAISDPGFAGLGTSVVSVINENVSLTDLRVQVEGNQLVVRDANTGQVLDRRPTTSTEQLRLDLSGGAKQLEIDSLGNFQNIIVIEAQDDDTINYGGGWVADPPRFINGRFTHVLRRDNAVLHVLNNQPHTNPYNPYDTNRDGVVTPSDALAIINLLQAGNIQLSDPQPDDTPSLFYLDVNNDGMMTPLDALNIINFLDENVSGVDASQSIAGFLSNQSLGGGNGEQIATDTSELAAIESVIANSLAGDSFANQAQIDQAIAGLFNDSSDDDEEEATDLLDSLADGLMAAMR